VMWIAVEAAALSSVLLVALYNRKTSLEAAWKYVMLGGLGLVLALFGTIFTYAAAIGKTGGERLPSFNWSRLLAMAPQLDHHLMTLAFIFVLVGFGTKAGLAPMHTWLPDAHSEAPTPTSAMLSGVSLKIALYALLRFHILTTACLGSGFSRNLLLGFGLFSMLLAGPFILVQQNLKRMLAYSSLEHVGLICVAVGMNAPLTVFGALLHMGYHALTKPVLFFAAGNVHQQFHTLDFRQLGCGLVRTMPLTALLLASPLAIVTRSMVTVPALRSKTRAVLLPLTVMLLAPGPLMVRASVTLSSLASVIVPVKPWAKRIVSAPGLAFARLTASRSEPAPLSARFMTVNVPGTVRSSSRSTDGRTRDGARALRRVSRAWRLREKERNMKKSPVAMRSAVQW